MLFHVDYGRKKNIFYNNVIIDRLCAYGILDTFHKLIFIYGVDIVKQLL